MKQFLVLFFSGLLCLTSLAQIEMPVCEFPVELQMNSVVGSISWSNGEEGTSIVVNQGGVYTASTARTVLDATGTGFLEATEIEAYESNAHTISFWVKPNEVYSTQDLVSKDGECFSRQWLLTISQGKIRAHVWTDGGNQNSFYSEPVVQVGEWLHVSQVWTGAHLHLYLNGELHESIPCTGALAPGNQPLRVAGGANAGCNQYEASVLMDDVAFWDIALSADDIESVYLGSQGATSGCTSLWTFDGENPYEDFGSAQNDLTGNLPTGTGMPEAVADFIVMLAPCEEHCGEGTVWDADSQTCIILNSSDTDFDGCVGMVDLLDLLSVFGTCSELDGPAEAAEWTCGDLLEYQGYDYSTVLIGEQCWFAENCRYLPYLNEVSDGSNTEPRYYILHEDHTDLADAQTSMAYQQYGALYNLPAALTGESLCPVGWHIPDIQEWQELGEFAEQLGPNSLKSDLWGGGGSGFNALPAGHKANYGDFVREFEQTDFWSSTVDQNCVNEVARLKTNELQLVTDETMFYCITGNSARCIKDLQ